MYGHSFSSKRWVISESLFCANPPAARFNTYHRYIVLSANTPYLDCLLPISPTYPSISVTFLKNECTGDFSMVLGCFFGVESNKLAF